MAGELEITGNLDQLSEMVDAIPERIQKGTDTGIRRATTEARRLLRHFHRITRQDGRIVAATLDPYETGDPAHAAYHEWNRQRGRMATVRFATQFSRARSSCPRHLSIAQRHRQPHETTS